MTLTTASFLLSFTFSSFSPPFPLLSPPLPPQHTLFLPHLSPSLFLSQLIGCSQETLLHLFIDYLSMYTSIVIVSLLSVCTTFDKWLMDASNTAKNYQGVVTERLVDPVIVVVIRVVNITIVVIRVVHKPNQ